MIIVIWCVWCSDFSIASFKLLAFFYWFIFSYCFLFAVLFFSLFLKKNRPLNLMMDDGAHSLVCNVHDFFFRPASDDTRKKTTNNTNRQTKLCPSFANCCSIIMIWFSTGCVLIFVVSLGGEFDRRPTISFHCVVWRCCVCVLLSKSFYFIAIVCFFVGFYFVQLHQVLIQFPSGVCVRACVCVCFIFLLLL